MYGGALWPISDQSYLLIIRYVTGAPNEDIVQNHLTKHCWAYFSIQTVDIGMFLSPKNFSSVRIF